MSNTAEQLDVGYNLDELLSLSFSYREEIKALEDEIKKIKEKKDPIDSTIIEILQEQGLTQTRNRVCSVSLKVQELPTAVDWSAIYGYLTESGNHQLLQRRISASAWQEIRELEDEIPGIEVFEKVSLNMRRT